MKTKKIAVTAAEIRFSFLRNFQNGFMINATYKVKGQLYFKKYMHTCIHTNTYTHTNVCVHTYICIYC